MKRMVKKKAIFVGIMAMIAGLFLAGCFSNPSIDAQAYFRRGQRVANEGMGDNRQAITYFTEAIKLDHVSPIFQANAFANRGLAYHRLGYFDMAIADFETALRLNPNNGIARSNYARVRQRQAAQRPTQPQLAQASSPASTQVSEADFRVEMNRDGTGLVIIQYIGTATVVHIPATIQGFPVTEIGTPGVGVWQTSSIVPVQGGLIVTRRQGAVDEDAITSVVIPEGVRIINVSAFRPTMIQRQDGFIVPFCRLRGLTSVTLPESLVYIRAGAFLDTRLTHITIPNGVTYIGAMAFARSSLTSVDLPAQITTIGGGAFSETLLRSLDLPSTIRSIGSGAFDRIPSLTTVNIPDSVTSIEFVNQNAFEGSRNLDLPSQARLRQVGYTGRF